MINDELRRQIEELANRLGRIEKRLGMSSPPDKVDATPPLPSLPPTDPAVLSDSESAKTESFATPPPTTLIPALPSSPSKAAIVSRITVRHQKPPEIARQSKPPQPTRSWETLIGMKLFAWLGSIVVVLGVSFFIKDQAFNWWGTLSEIARCWLVAGFGLVLLTAGEVIYRLIGKLASVGLFSAGIVILYLDAWASFRFYDLVEKPTAFIFMGLVATAGFALTWRTRFRTIGVLSTIGGYLVPIFIGIQRGHDLELLIYLTMLLGIALSLSAVRPREFRTLRYVALAGQSLIVLIWMVDHGAANWEMAIVFSTMWWMMVLAEAVFAALRRQSAIGNVIMTVLSTLAFVTAGAWILNSPIAGNEPWLGAFTLAVGLLCAAAAAQFGPGLDVLRGSLRYAIDKLALALWAQLGVLLIVAIAMQFEDYGQSIAWLILGLASIEIGRRLPSRGIDVFGLIVGTLAVGRIFLLDSWINSALTDTLWDAGIFIINGWSILALAAIFTMVIAAHRLRTTDISAWRFVAIALTGIAGLGWMIVCAAQCEGLAITGGWIVVAAILTASHRFCLRLCYLNIALFIVLFATVRWLIVDATGHRLDSAWTASDALPLLNWQMALAVSIGVMVWWISRAKRALADQTSPSTTRVIWQWVAAFGAIFMLIALSFEVERMLTSQEIARPDALRWPGLQLRALWLTAFWAAGGGAMWLTGNKRTHRPLVFCGVAIMVLSAVSWLTYCTISWWMSEGAVEALLLINLQSLVGLFLIGLLGVFASMQRLHRRVLSNDRTLPHLILVMYALTVAIGIWIGTLEIDRYFIANDVARHAGFSVFWSLYALGLIAIGFIKRLPAARYVGLGLFGLTTVKVLFWDLRETEQLWRVASFVVSGLLLIVVSIVYAKLSPKLSTQSENDKES